VEAVGLAAQLLLEQALEELVELGLRRLGEQV
jgi:hypothetical protein